MTHRSLCSRITTRRMRVMALTTYNTAVHTGIASFLIIDTGKKEKIHIMLTQFLSAWTQYIPYILQPYLWCYWIPRPQGHSTHSRTQTAHSSCWIWSWPAAHIWQCWRVSFGNNSAPHYKLVKPMIQTVNETTFWNNMGNKKEKKTNHVPPSCCCFS